MRVSEIGVAKAAIFVEGRRDRLALERLGFSGPVEVLNRGWPVDDVLVHLVETYGRRREEDGGQASSCSWIGTAPAVASSPPFDETLESLDVRFDEKLRSTLMRCLKPETRVVEGLSGLADALGPLVDMYDDELSLH